MLISGFPEGVIGLPPLHTALQLKRFLNLAPTSVAVDQFVFLLSRAQQKNSKGKLVTMES
ncbi:LOW QUALITY PROTEIN: hypothetical protein PHMEG_00030530 [Phytophthora megakarya]|uniref:Uncharacterized protein n=1 Tax=Phytophthora megakarya TaxID=4795 RepID=A0A225V0G0_9STRA|nr:LOW QUALITY PROTEIN: hypothetical protein PHMEG_00030530 [Phytophthora megakarya]